MAGGISFKFILSLNGVTSYSLEQLQNLNDEVSKKPSYLHSSAMSKYEKADDFIYEVSSGKYDIQDAETVVFSKVGEPVAAKMTDGTVLTTDEEELKELLEGQRYTDLTKSEREEFEKAIQRNPAHPEKEKIAIRYKDRAKQQKYETEQNTKIVDREVKKQTEKSAKTAVRANTKEDVDRKANAAKQAASAKLKSLQDSVRKRIESEKEKLRSQYNLRPVEKGVRTKVRVNKTSATKAFKSSFKANYGQTGSVVKQKITDFVNKMDISKDMYKIAVTKPANVLVTGKRYKLPKQLQGVSLKQFKKMKDLEMKKIVYFIWRGCLACATYFQILVSNTPMDEDYDYKTTTVTSSRLKYYDKNGNLKDEDTLAKEADVRYSEVTRHHKADTKYVRGDWTIAFRGKVFKAFETEPEKGAATPNYDYVFTKDLFYKKADKKSCEKIADIMFEVTKNSDPLLLLDNTFQENNSNPRMLFLEYGGYYTRKGTPVRGAKYTHGVDETLLTYQAPYGFWEIARAQWDDLVSSGRWAGSIDQYVNFRANKLDVSKVESAAMKTLFEQHPELKKMNKVIGAYK